MKKIIAKWVTPKPGEEFGYHKEMKVVYSDHDKFITGSRFDFSFLQIANEQGFVVEVLP